MFFVSMLSRKIVNFGIRFFFFFLWLLEKYYEYVCFFVFFFFLNEYLGCWMILSWLFHVVLGFVF